MFKQHPIIDTYFMVSLQFWVWLFISITDSPHSRPVDFSFFQQGPNDASVIGK